MKTIKKDILRSVFIVIILNLIALAVFSLLEIKMLLLIKKVNEYEQSITYVTVTNSLFSINNMMFDLLIPIISYIVFFFFSFLILVYKINTFVKEINDFNIDAKDSLEHLKVNPKIYSYKELNDSNNMIKEAIFKIKKNNLIEKEIINTTMHDLKTPLHIISGYNSLNELLNANKYKEQIDKQLFKINEIIETSISKEEYFKIKEENILFLIEDLVSDYKNIYSNVKIDLITEEKEIIWNVDKISFKRIIMNLIDNAIKATVQTTAPIEINIEQNFISIKNYGEVLSEEKFNEYSSKKDMEGKSFGLRIIKRYSEKNNLNIKIYSTNVYTIIKLLYNYSK